MTVVTQTELAAALGVGATTISKWTKAGFLNAKKNGRGLLYDLDESRTWFEQVGQHRKNIGVLVERDATGRLVDFLREQCEELKDLGEGDGDLKDLTVMTVHADPFRVGQPSHHETGRWLLAQYDLLAKGRRIHLRGLHYMMVARGNVIKPDGERYTNTFENWDWLVDNASKWARWLGYIPFGWLVDEYNDAAVSYVPEAPGEPYGKVINADTNIDLPDDADEAMPAPTCGNLAPRQPWRIIFVGEKSSLAEVVRPIAIRVGAEMQLFTGTSSLTGMAQIAEHIIADGRPAVVLYLADFDPKGWEMPIVFSRQLQGYICMKSHGSTVQVRRVALTKEQCEANDLPSTPLKATEKNAERWIEAWGREQTEIDALAALQPEVLRRIVNDAVTPFWDHSLDARAAEAQEEWEDEVRDAIEAHPDYDAAREIVEEALDDLRAAVNRYNEARILAAETLKDVELPDVEPVEPLDENGREFEFDEVDKEAVFDTRAGFIDATQKLKFQRAYERRVVG